MQIAASAVREGDVIRGIGLVVEFNEPQTDFEARLAGHIVVNRETGETYGPVSIIVPNEHKVNVRRLFAVGDVVTVPVYEWDEDAEDFMGEQFVRSEVLHVHGDEKLLTIRREGDPTDNDVTSVPFFRARHAAPAAV